MRTRPVHPLTQPVLTEEELKEIMDEIQFAQQCGVHEAHESMKEIIEDE